VLGLHVLEFRAVHGARHLLARPVAGRTCLLGLGKIALGVRKREEKENKENTS
jgi:hypothetical protein